MKKLILGLALLGLAAGCKSQDTAQISDADQANVPAAECCASECGDTSDCGAKSECDGASECDSKEDAVCPYSGEKIEN